MFFLVLSYAMETDVTVIPVVDMHKVGFGNVGPLANVTTETFSW